MIWTKGAHQSEKCQTFNCSPEISPNLYIDRLLLLKVYKISAKKVLCTLIGPFRAKYIIFDLKKYGGAIFYDTEE